MRMYLFDECVEETDGLDGFSQTHLVSENGVGALSPGEPEPVETLELVGVEGASRHCDVIRLFIIFLLGLRGKRGRLHVHD